MRRIGDQVVYDRGVSDEYINNGMPKNEMFLSGEKGPWLVTGGFRALDMAGPLWFDIPKDIEDSVAMMDENDDHGELIVYKRVVFIQTNHSKFYKRHYQTEAPGPLRKIWRDYYFAAFYASLQHILSERGSTIVLNNPAIGNGWPMWMWGLFCGASLLLAKSKRCNISITDLADLPPDAWDDCENLDNSILSPVRSNKKVSKSTEAIHVDFWPTNAQQGAAPDADKRRR